MKSNAEMSENRFLGSISASSIRNLLHRSVSTKHKTNSTRSKSGPDGENNPPIDPNILVDKDPIPKQSLSEHEISQREITKSDSQKEVLSPPADPPVKVVVRIRPANGHEREGDQLVRKLSDDSVAAEDKKFTFDSVLDSKSNQEYVFQLVGVPLVKNALAGYNTTILAYGQTGSGKSYTMWGPPSAMVENQASNSHQGIVPRIFQMLFSEIQQEKENSEGKQINFQCRCSFLEIYNEQIGDLLDPTQRNLEIRDDTKHGFYVENLTEEYVTGYEDITQILIKGLLSRKVGATSIHSESSQSHIVFTCVIESWCKGTSSKCFGSSKTSRISLVDLAGLERSKLDDDGRQCVKEEKNVKKSLSQLGHLVNILAEGGQSGKTQDIAYRSSSLTNLLKESLGGNVKLAVICAISPNSKSSCETLSTLRFGQRVRSIHNEPVINEISEDDVDLSDQIRQLKEELIRAKSCNSVGSNYGYSTGRSVCESLNHLRLSLNRSLILPRIDNDAKDKAYANDDDVRELRLQLNNVHSSGEEKIEDTYESSSCIQFSSVEGGGSDTELTSDHYGSSVEESETDEFSLDKSHTELQQEESSASVDDIAGGPHTSKTIDTAFRSSISISSSHQCSVFQDPTLSESPKFQNNHRKSITFASSTHLASQNIVSESSKVGSDVSRQSHRRSDIRSSLRSSKIFPGPTESLAASLQRGLQIIDSHQQNSASDTPSVAFSFEHLALKPCPTGDRARAKSSLQTLSEERPSTYGSSTSFLCASSRRTGGLTGSTEVRDSLKALTLAVDSAGNSNGLIAYVPKDAGKGLAEASRREKELESICMEQAAKIEQLNLLVEQYKHDRKQNSILKHSYTLHPEDLNNEIIQIDELKNRKFHSPKDERKPLRWDDSENHEIINEKYEIKEIMEEMGSEYRKTSFDINEKEVLLNEIQSLRSKLPSFTEGTPTKSFERVRSSLLLQSIQLRKSGAFSQGNNEEELEKERQRWMEMESEWISLTDELRIELESNRRRAEKVEMELILEKKCTEELDEVLQRSVIGHARMVEHYSELQEKYNDLVGKYQLTMEGIAELKKAAAKAGAKGRGSRFAKSLEAELSALRVERAREMELLKKENRNLKIQLRDTAEAVQAAGELLVRLKEAEEVASVAEENVANVQEENDKLKDQVKKLKRKHKMEMITMKQYLAESRLPESALRPLYREDYDVAHNTSPLQDDDQAWRAEFGAIYQDHY